MAWIWSIRKYLIGTFCIVNETEEKKETEALQNLIGTFCIVNLNPLRSAICCITI